MIFVSWCSMCLNSVIALPKPLATSKRLELGGRVHFLWRNSILYLYFSLLPYIYIYIYTNDVLRIQGIYKRNISLLLKFSLAPLVRVTNLKLLNKAFWMLELSKANFFIVFQWQYSLGNNYWRNKLSTIDTRNLKQQDVCVKVKVMRVSENNSRMFVPLPRQPIEIQWERRSGVTNSTQDCSENWAEMF